VADRRRRNGAPEHSVATYYEVLIDGSPLSEHLTAAAMRNGFRPEPTERGPEFLFGHETDGFTEDNVGFFNYLCPAGWTRPEWREEWAAWLKGDGTSELPDHGVPLLVCGYCGSWCATTARLAHEGDAVRWFAF
jgi:hypothetical protein